jgi:nitrogen fixation/metabolism regulation signal transduction histidine kinase
MAFRSSFRLNVVLRVAVMAALLFGVLWSLLRSGWDATPVVCAVLLAVALAELVRYVETGTRDLTQLLRAAAAGDFATTLPRRWSGPPFADYEQASRQLVGTFQRLDLQRAASDELLRAVVDHVGTALLCFAADGRVAFANPAARQMLRLPAAEPASPSLARLAAADERLAARLLALRDDERTQVEVSTPGEAAVLLLHARRFTLLDEAFTVVVCHDIRGELESRDLQAWQSLARVLTHEMMNSLTPIITLSGHLRDTLGRQPQQDGDTLESVEVIHERSSGLARFIEAYRQFAHPPAPLPANVSVSDLLDRVARLKRPELEGLKVAFEVRDDAPGASVLADARQIEQVLINLVRNAQQALAGRAGARIELSSGRDDRGHVLLHVTDNGPGIAPEVAGKVFMPFFTTRSDGTGIGLALSRQLMALNRGSISVSGEPGRCQFTLRLPAAPG